MGENDAILGVWQSNEPGDNIQLDHTTAAETARIDDDGISLRSRPNDSRVT